MNTTEAVVPIPPSDWAVELQAFTMRHAARRCVVEVEAGSHSARVQEHDWPFLGAAYDHRDRRVELMLGDLTGASRHLSRGITGVDRLEFVIPRDGGPESLQITHGDTRTLLKFVR